MTKFFRVPTKICENILLDILKGVCEEPWRNDTNSPKQGQHNITKFTFIHLQNNSQTKTMLCLFQPNSAPQNNPYRGPLMVIYKKDFDVMLHLEAEWPSKQNILIADTLGRTRPGSAGIGWTVARKSSVGGFMFVQGARHSANLYLIHNMHSICRLRKLIINFSRKYL